MDELTYFCETCDRSFKTPGALTNHTRASKDHARRAASLGVIRPDAPPITTLSEDPDVEPPVLPSPGEEEDSPFTIPTPELDQTDDPFSLRVPDTDGLDVATIEEAMQGVRLTGDGAQILTPLKDVDLTKQEKITNARPNRKLNVSLRTIKMLAPRCDEHNDGVPGWWYHCLEEGHDPYKSSVEHTAPERVLSAEPDAQGRYRVLRTEDVVFFSITYNTRQLPYTGKHNGGIEVSQAGGKGWVMPEKRGVAPFCQFLNCWVQNPQVSTPYGDFCIREQAQLVAAEMTATFLDVNNETHRAQQLAALGV